MKAKAAGLLLGAVAALAVGSARAQTQQPPPGTGLAPLTGESPRTAMVELKLGLYKPLIGQEASLTGNPYDETFGSSPMLLGTLEVDRELWQGFGTAAVGLSLGYAEKYAPAQIVDSTGAVTGTSDRTGLFVLPIRLMGIYRFDWPALHLGIPLVPYAKLALAYTPWWSTKGSGIDYSNGTRAAGGKWGYGFIGGLSFLLDALEPRLARDLDTELGINHTYLFAEYTYENVNNFGAKGLDLSGRYWAFGLGLEF